ncbi:MAG TPA: histidine--tRNA ligase, partial [Firmicutes bacterium]|nr:histidine--tRNA ligase [Bacillota bacterium]
CAAVIKDAPSISQNRCAVCENKYTIIKNLLSAKGLKFIDNPQLVRGLDYYTGAVYEFTTDVLGPQQNTILAGGRYDNLVKELGGKDVPATGFAAGIERLIETVKSNANAGETAEDGVFIVYGAGHKDRAFSVLLELREQGIKSFMNFDEKSFKSQLREASAKKAGFALIIGDDEVKENNFTVKNMVTGGQFKKTGKELAAVFKT